MASTSETGHAKNVANGLAVCVACDGFGADYQPSNPELTLSAIQTKQGTSAAAQEDFNKQEGIYTPAVNARQIVYLPVEKIARRAVGMLATSGADDKIVADARGIVDRITGDNISKNKRRNDKKKKTAADDAAGLGVSVSQLSYDRVLDNFEKFIELLKNEPKYNPNEVDLKITALETLKGDMKVANKAVLDAETPYVEALQLRNKELYEDKKGLVDIMLLVKEYVKNAFGGVKSPRYKQISGLKFTRPEK